MIDQQLRIDSEHMVEKVFIIIIGRLSQGAPCDISHCIQSLFLQLLCVSAPDPPEICQRTVGPERPAVRHLIELRDPHAVLVRRDMFRPDIHRCFAQIQVRTDSRCRCDPCRLEHIQDHFPRQLPCRHLIGPQIRRRVNEHFIDGIDMDILRGDIFQVHLIDLAADLHIARHLRRRCHKIHRKRGIPLQLRSLAGRPCKLPSRRALPPGCIDLPDFLFHLKEPRPAGDAVSLQRRRDSKADRLLCTAPVSHHQIRCHRIQSPLHTFDRGIKRFQVDRDISPLLHPPRLLSAFFSLLFSRITQISDSNKCSFLSYCSFFRLRL